MNQLSDFMKANGTGRSPWLIHLSGLKKQKRRRLRVIFSRLLFVLFFVRIFLFQDEEPEIDIN